MRRTLEEKTAIPLLAAGAIQAEEKPKPLTRRAREVQQSNG